MCGISADIRKPTSPNPKLHLKQHSKQTRNRLSYGWAWCSRYPGNGNTTAGPVITSFLRVFSLHQKKNNNIVGGFTFCMTFDVLWHIICHSSYCLIVPICRLCGVLRRNKFAQIRRDTVSCDNVSYSDETKHHSQSSLRLTHQERKHRPRNAIWQQRKEHQISMILALSKAHSNTF